ncbi:MAG: hypothetical protein LUD17_09510 [Bacteroidales bacterium]|nr:hypothetical protein [Bacteroidales bacterium]
MKLKLYLISGKSGPLYFCGVALPSLVSAGLSKPFNFDHKKSWIEKDASRRGAAHFDKKYGTGAAGYVKDDPNYFDKYFFEHGGRAPYINPHTGSYRQNGFPL